jgi:serine/threonine protein kinase
MTATPTVIGRYAIFDRIAAGGMASVHVGRLLGEAGFFRTVAIKRLHAQFALDPDFVAMFLDEARICARIRHQNVVPTLDVVARDGELFLVMEYVEGESVSQLLAASKRKGQTPPPSVVASIICGVLHGLHAAHEAKSDKGEPLGIVHRDVSPQNVLVGTDGIARVLDFGVAKAVGRLHTTRDGAVKGKLAYMAPEQIQGDLVSVRTDVFAASVVLWEALTGQRLFQAEHEARRMHMILHEPLRSPRELTPEVSPELDSVVMRGLERKSDARYSSALEMAEALERAVPPATPRVVGAWVRSLSAENLASRAERVAEVESFSSTREQQVLPSPPASARREQAVAADDFTVLDPGSITQASSISVSKSSAPGVHGVGARRTGVRLGLAAAALFLTGGLLIHFVRVSRAGPGPEQPAMSASALAVAPAPPVDMPATLGSTITPSVSASAPDAAIVEDAARRPSVKRPPRPKKAIYSRE